jgi:uncharacterized protein YukE
MKLSIYKLFLSVGHGIDEFIYRHDLTESMLGKGGILNTLLGKQSDSDKNENAERVRKLYESLHDLNNTLIQIRDKFDTYYKKINKTAVHQNLGNLENILTDISIQLKTINTNLKNLTTSSGLLSIAISGGADKLLNDLCTEIDKLNEYIKNFIKDYLDTDHDSNGRTN